MAITATNLATTGSSSDASSYATASLAFTTDRLVLAWVYTMAAGAPNTPTASGGLTWVQVATQVDGPSGDAKITLFRGMGSATSAITFDFGGQTQLGCVWSVVEYDGVDTSGTNGSGAVVQSAGNTGSGTTASATLAAFGSASNGTVGGFGVESNNNPTAGSGFTRMGTRAQSSPNMAAASEFRADNDTGVDMGVASASWAGVAAEIKAGAAAPTATGNFFAVL